MSQLILPPFCRFTNITAHSTALPWLHLRHRHFTYVTAHNTTLLPLHLCYSSFSNRSFASPTSHFILQPFFRFSYVTSSSLNSPGELILQPFRHFTYVTTHSQPFRRFTYITAHSPTLLLLHQRHISFSNPSFASPTSQALHLIHLASRPWFNIRDFF